MMTVARESILATAEARPPPLESSTATQYSNQHTEGVIDAWNSNLRPVNPEGDILSKQVIKLSVKKKKKKKLAYATGHFMFREDWEKVEWDEKATMRNGQFLVAAGIRNTIFWPMYTWLNRNNVLTALGEDT